MSIQSTTISNFVADQFPAFYKSEGPQFIAFMEAYYEYMEQEGSVIGDSRNLLTYRDIDTTLERFISHFSAKYLYGIPDKVKFDKPFLIKHILDVYRSKGTVRGYKLLFKMLYDEDIEIYLPSRDIFRLSDGKWYEPQFVEVGQNINNDRLLGNIVRGTSSNAEAVVDSYIKQPVKNRIIHIFYLTNITGKFVRGEKLVLETERADPQAILAAPTIAGSFETLTVIQGGQKFRIGDELVALNGSGIEGEALVTQVANGTGTLAFSIIAGGTMYSMDAEEVITRKVLGSNNQVIERTVDSPTPLGRGASFDIGSITNVSQQTYNNELIYDFNDTIIQSGVKSIVVGTKGTGYANTLEDGITSTPLVFTNRFYLSELRVNNRGMNYANGDTIRVTGGTTQALATIQTFNDGQISAVDIINPGLWQTNSTATIIVQSTSGGGASFAALLANTGTGATGYIVTNNSGQVQEARVSNTGIGYVVAPIVTVGNSTGTGVVLTANVQNDYGFRDLNPSYMFTTIENALTHTTKLFGSIGSLTNIATGNNYISEPDVAVRDLLYSRNLQGNVYFSNTGIEVRGIGTNFTSVFKPGDVIRLEMVDDLPDVRFDHRIVKSVANNTYLTVDDNPRYNANGNIDALYVLNGGTNYKNTDTVSVTGGGGTGLVVRISTDNNGVIVKATPENIGNGYTTRPTMTVVSTTGNGANLYATVTDSDYYLAANLVSANWYAPNDLVPNIYIPGQDRMSGEDSIIQGLPIFGTGIIKTVKIKNAGLGYLEGEYVSFATIGAVNPIIIEDGGHGYANGDSLVFSGGSPLTAATGEVTTDGNGTIIFVSLTYPGSGYKFVPEIYVISADGEGAVLSATIGGLNTKYNVSGYVNLGGIGTLKGYWATTDGFTSSNKYLQDSYYYQDYSYEIQSSIPFAQYSDIVKKMFHMAGNEMFGRLIKTDLVEGSSSVPYDNIQHREP